MRTKKKCSGITSGQVGKQANKLADSGDWHKSPEEKISPERFPAIRETFVTVGLRKNYV